MANPLRGEVSFSGTDGVTRTLSFSAEALFRLEQQLGKPISTIEQDMRDLQKSGVGTVRTMFWAGLLDTNPGLPLEDIGEIFSKVDLVQVLDLVAKAFNGAFGVTSETAPASPPEPGQPQ